MRAYVLLVGLAACASHPPARVGHTAGGPRGLRASEHLDVADQQRDMARQDATFPDMRNNGINTGVPLATGTWFRSWGPSTDHEENARYHRAAAGAIYADYTAACGTKPSTEVMVSPLVRFSTGGWPTQAGAIIYLSNKAGTADEVMAALVCHRAWMMLSPTDMQDCPLDLPGLGIDARGDKDGITVSLSIKDTNMIPELQRRVAHDLETAQQRAAPVVTPALVAPATK